LKIEVQRRFDGDFHILKNRGENTPKMAVRMKCGQHDT